jgi:hypothetical protein
MNDDEINALYRLPPGEFTAARNVLAKARGAAGAAIKTLEKPSLPAWSVNQIYWHDRPTFEALITASAAMRQAHVQVISGRSADVAGAEATHTAAVKTAVASARRLIDAAGEKATPATIDAITETLQALPTEDTPGRLTKPLKPLSFSALLAMGIPVVQGPTRSMVHGSGGLARRSLGEGGSMVHGSSKKEIAEQAAARKLAEKALKAATTAEENAEAAHAEAKKAATHVERELARVRDRVQFLEKQRNDAEEVLRQRARALQDATNARIQAAQDVGRLTP